MSLYKKQIWMYFLKKQTPSRGVALSISIICIQFQEFGLVKEWQDMAILRAKSFMHGSVRVITIRRKHSGKRAKHSPFLISAR